MSQVNCLQCGALYSDREFLSSSLSSNECLDVAASTARVGELEFQIQRLQLENDTLSTSLKLSTEQKTTLEFELAQVQLDLKNSKGIIDDLRSTLSQIRTSDASQLQLDMQSLAEKLITETATRSEIEHAKIQIETELEELSARLFEEANSMVATEKKLRLEAERKYAILERQLTEVQDLATSQKDELDDLKSRLEQTADEKDKESAERIRMEKERDELEMALMDGSVSGSPRSSYRLSRSGSNRLSLSSVPSDSAYGSSYSDYEYGNNELELTFHLSDFRFEEFKEFLDTPKNAKNMYISKFIKRTITEDIEPAMRFESSNVRGWFQQRKLTNATQSGTLIIETVNSGSPVSSPVSTPCKKQSIPVASSDTCNLCLQHINTPIMYRIRYDDFDNEPKDICAFCRERLFSVCEFYTFVRLVHSGIIKGTPQRLYLEANRLRLKIFLGRIGSNVTTDGFDEIKESNALALK
ncbi:hypothetical protein K493DRAFT_298864 [Basidiobolus meristosporus CBS 931.73]|uniref:GDP/GTP exchange factor Sec2 N-terminal domain-containing protein n=1 Tax=Basidiobolus meristosporus CBS 931.73 TaxID=1314790 RepID=A0A1Y1YRB0_9FUNG|nr:hypothetical protein K493DRAFT_298864 [Basidiobolus meristosporus CBS 931.73]|eukprot:ORY00506.1 hypothetical protein K493DRAFT_298864 [Basidiobolus meristosporus CBS 931.73]